MARTAEVDELHALLNTKKDTLAQLRGAVSLKSERQYQVMQQLSPAILVERLADAAQVADSESEEIASAFLDGMSLPSLSLLFPQYSSLFRGRCGRWW